MAEGPEKKARAEIDRLLAAAGWAVQRVEEADRHAARGVAICEFPLATGKRATFLVAFMDRNGNLGNPIPMNDEQVWPTPEEQQSEEARQRRVNQQLRVFLCHGSEDKAAVRAMRAALLQEQMRPWLDEVDIAPGADWDSAISAAVKEAHIVLVFLSRTSIDKTGYVQKEIRFVLDRADEMPEGRTFIIPVRLDDCAVPSRLSRWQAITFRDSAARKRLLQTLRQHARQVQQRAA